MSVFSLAQRTTATGASTPAQEVIASSTNAFKLIEYGVSINAATLSGFALGYPQAKGVGATSPVTGLNEDRSSATTGQTTSALAWGTTAPTVPTAFFKRIILPASIGAGVIWTFPRGVKVLKNSTMVNWIVSAGASAVADVWWVVDE